MILFIPKVLWPTPAHTVEERLLGDQKPKCHFSFIPGKLINVFVFSLTDITQVVFVLFLFFCTGAGRKVKLQSPYQLL